MSSLPSAVSLSGCTEREVCHPINPPVMTPVSGHANAVAPISNRRLTPAEVELHRFAE